MPPVDHTVGVNYLQNCYQLFLDHTGEGIDPIPDPDRSVACPTGRYHTGEAVLLTAAPADGWFIGGWHGTDNDPSQDDQNRVTMPRGAHTAGVDYVQIDCGPLTLTHTGDGADPSATPRGNGATWSEIVVAPPGQPLDTIERADIDGDGDIDVVSAHSDGLRLWENADGAGGTWTERIVDSEATEVVALAVGDFDGDGDLDIAGGVDESFAEELHWWENVAGDGSIWTTEVIAIEIPVESLAAADLLGNGRDDLVAISFYGLSRWDFVGGPLRWIEVAIEEAFFTATDIVAGDVDGDGDLDLVGTAGGTAFEDGELRWWENDGGEAIDWPPHTVTPDIEADAVATADLDGDGDLDLLATSEEDGDILLWINATGDGLEWSESAVDSGLELLAEIDTGDIDGDGDVDVVGSVGDSVLWWANLFGDGLSWVETTLDPSLPNASEPLLADIDSDGDLDLLAASLGDDEVRLWHNDYVTMCPPGEFGAGDILQLEAAPDPGSGVSAGRAPTTTPRPLRSTRLRSRAALIR